MKKIPVRVTLVKETQICLSEVENILGLVKKNCWGDPEQHWIDRNHEIYDPSMSYLGCDGYLFIDSQGVYSKWEIVNL